MSTDALQFKEIEHKYVVDEQFEAQVDRVLEKVAEEARVAYRLG